MRKKNLALMAGLYVVSIQPVWAMDPRDEDEIQNAAGSPPIIISESRRDEEPRISIAIGAPSLTQQKPELIHTDRVKRGSNISLRLNLEVVQQPRPEESPASPTLLSPKESPKSSPKGRERRPSTQKTLPVRPRVGSGSRGVKSSTAPSPHAGRSRTTSEPQTRRLAIAIPKDISPSSPWVGRPIPPKQVLPDREVSDQRLRSQSKSQEDSSSEEILEWGSFERKKRDPAPPRSRSRSESPEDSYSKAIIDLGDGRDPSPRRPRSQSSLGSSSEDSPEDPYPGCFLFPKESPGELLRSTEAREKKGTTHKIFFSPTDQEELRTLLHEIKEKKRLPEIEKKK